MDEIREHHVEWNKPDKYFMFSLLYGM
jgi:hypothetical protein